MTIYEWSYTTYNNNYSSEMIMSDTYWGLAMIQLLSSLQFISQLVFKIPITRHYHYLHSVDEETEL